MGNLSNPDAYSGIVKGLGGGGSSVDFPTDITNPQDGQTLQYDATSEKWVNVDNTSCVEIVNSTIENRSITQDEVDSYFSDIGGNVLSTQYIYTVISLGVTLNNITGNKIYRSRSVYIDTNSEVILSLDNVNIIEQPGYYEYTLINITGENRAFVVNKNTELKLFSNPTTPK